MPYGETWIDESTDLNVIGYKFTGKELDTETGLYYYGARYLDPQSSRWLSPDLAGQGINWYGYCGNNPVNYVDPTGEVAIADDVAVLVVLGGLATYAYLSSPAGQRAVQDSVTWAASGAGIFGNRRDSLYDFPSVPVGSSNTTIPQFPSRELQYNHQGAPATYQESSDTFSPSITDKALEYAPFTFPQLDVKDYAHFGAMYLSTEDKTKYWGSYAPERSLPRSRYGDPIPDVDVPHTQLGKRDDGYGPYNQARTWEMRCNGKGITATIDIDFSDHGSPSSHSKPHQHRLTPNNPNIAPRGGYRRGDPESLT